VNERNRERRHRGEVRDRGPVQGRVRRVGAEHAFELARHLTERDREVALCLYEQQALTTDQLVLLFFSSKRRAQDRLLFLYRERVLDRFYPAAPFGVGKAQAHWLLDEAGALLVAARLGLDRKRLDWERREDWRSHPQLLHRLELNRFVTDLIADTLPGRALGVSAWHGPREAAMRLGKRMRERLRPDAELILSTTAGAIDLLLEWDRGTETSGCLSEKLRRYRLAERQLRYDDTAPRSILFVVPGPGRLQTLRRVCTELDQSGSWPVIATTSSELRASGPLASIWQRLDRDTSPLRLTALPVRHDVDDLDIGLALGRRWRHDNDAFWERLSPLGRKPWEEDNEVAAVDRDRGLGPPTPTTKPTARDADGFLARRGAEVLDEAHRDVAAARARRRGTPGVDLRLSEIDGFMDYREADEEGS
jgi:hypothetical protein